MFHDFFYILRAHGLDVSLKEWLTLMEGLRLELHRSTMDGFFLLCRAVLCKSEADYDKFQQAFAAYFLDGPSPLSPDTRVEISDQLNYFLNHPGEKGPRIIRKTAEDITEEMASWTQEQIEAKLRRRLKNQKKEHNGGYIYVGTHGISPYGNEGSNPNAIRIGGAGKTRAALHVARSQSFRDFREDNVLDIRQFQMAFRKLRHFTMQNQEPEEFSISRTIDDTCKMGGLLQIRYQRPRKNSMKVLLLMDSGGTMDPHSRLVCFFRPSAAATTFRS